MYFVFVLCLFYHFVKSKSRARLEGDFDRSETALVRCAFSRFGDFAGEAGPLMFTSAARPVFFFLFGFFSVLS